MLNKKMNKEKTIDDKKNKNVVIVEKEKSVIFGKQFEVLTFTNTQFILKR